MKVIDLNRRTIYVDDIKQIYSETSYGSVIYNIQTTYGTYSIDKEDYFKVKDYLLSLNDEVEIIEEAKKIPEKLPIGLKQTKDGIFNTIVKDDIQYELNEKEEIICRKIHEIIDYLKSKGE